MDPNSNQHVEINDINSLFTSFSPSFGQLEMNPITGDGPINRLPNELMQMILAKLELDYDLKKLLRLRLVSTRWKAVIEDYCGLKKSLIVDMHQTELSSSDLSYIEKRFFGFANLKNFVFLFISTKISSECLRSVLNLFPNVVQLSIYWENDTRVTDLVAYINSLNSLKQLDLQGPFVRALPSINSTLSKLDHVSFDIGKMDGTDDNEHYQQQVVSHLGPSCVRVDFGLSFNHDHILQWHNINPLWMASLTHLRVHNANLSFDCSKALNFLCEHAISLKHLSFMNLRRFMTLKLTPILIGNLRKLANLTELELSPIEMDISELGQAIAQHRPISLSSVLTCKLLHISVCYLANEDQFSCVLSAIFTNVLEHNFLNFNFQSRCTVISYPELHALCFPIP